MSSVVIVCNNSVCILECSYLYSYNLYQNYHVSYQSPSLSRVALLLHIVVNIIAKKNVQYAVSALCTILAVIRIYLRASTNKY